MARDGALGRVHAEGDSIAEYHLKKAGIDDMVIAQSRRKGRWAGGTVRREDSRCSQNELNWTLEGGARSVGQPSLRWRDVLDRFSQERMGGLNWQFAAHEREEWKTLEDEFAIFRI